MVQLSTPEMAKRFYNRGAMTTAQLKALVKKGLDDNGNEKSGVIGKLTKAEFKEITGYDYK